MASTLPDGALRKLEAWAATAPVVATTMVREMTKVAEREVRAELSRSSHAPGTPTPSAPGDPPSMVSGRLQRLVTTTTRGPGWAQVGSAAPYARIQERGGVTGRGGATILPPRPYLRAALRRATPQMLAVAVTRLREALTR